jgi:hypothetical protein
VLLDPELRRLAGQESQSGVGTVGFIIHPNLLIECPALGLKGLQIFGQPGQKIGKIHSGPIKTLLNFIKETAIFKGEERNNNKNGVQQSYILDSAHRYFVRKDSHFNVGT